VPTISRDALIEKIAEGLRDTWHCTRVWEAWSVGTMSEEDFSPVDESDTPAELADAILAMLAVAPLPPAQPRDRLTQTAELLGSSAPVGAKLGAMAKYPDGHLWDQLDSQVCMEAAALLAAQPEPVNRRLLDALTELREQCSGVSPFANAVAVKSSVLEIRRVGKFMAACERADEALGAAKKAASDA
jgi:hypothetical protein